MRCSSVARFAVARLRGRITAALHRRIVVLGAVLMRVRTVLAGIFSPMANVSVAKRSLTRFSWNQIGLENWGVDEHNQASVLGCGREGCAPGEAWVGEVRMPRNRNPGIEARNGRFQFRNGLFSVEPGTGS